MEKHRKRWSIMEQDRKRRENYIKGQAWAEQKIENNGQRIEYGIKGYKNDQVKQLEQYRIE